MRKKSSSSPVIKANVKLCVYEEPPFWVEVRFRNIEEIDNLIKALRQLRDSKGDQFNHVHLQDSRIGSLVGGEIVYFRPGLKVPGWERHFITRARKMLEKYRMQEKKKT